MDGGIIESMLIGSAIGGGSAMLTGGDPLKGALTGGLTGGITGGLMPGASATPISTGVNALEAAAPTAASGFSSAASMAPDLTGSGVGSAFSAPGAVTTPSLSGGITGLGGPSLSDITGFGASAPASLNAAGQAAASTSPEFFKDPINWWKNLSTNEKMLYGGGAGLGLMMLQDRNRFGVPKQTAYAGPLSKFRYDPSSYTPTLPYADGGITTIGGSNIAVGGDPRRNPAPISEDNTTSDGWQSRSFPSAHMAEGGIASLGSYSDGGRLLKGPGDGMSDNIPAVIGRKQPARLAEGEFVVPADVVSHLGNGSTDAGAKQLYTMMDKVRRARTGRKDQGREINPRKYMPA